MKTIKVCEINKIFVCCEDAQNVFDFISDLLKSEHLCLDFSDVDFTALALNEFFNLMYANFSDCVINQNLSFVNFENGYEVSRIKEHQRRIKYDPEYRNLIHDIWEKEFAEE